VRTLVTIPVHNEAARIMRNGLRLEACLREAHQEHVLAIVEDGSTDGTLDEVQRLKGQVDNLLVQTLTYRSGRGAALRKLWKSNEFDAYCYVDADLPAGPEAVLAALHALEEGADIAIGSRYCRGAQVTRPPLVKFMSRRYNQLIRTLFHDGVYDHQCGLKAIRREALIGLLDQVDDNSWFWDTELIIRGKRDGYQLAEIPLDWVETRNRKTSVGRLANEVPYFLSNIVRLSGQLHGPLPTTGGATEFEHPTP
jgi:glycosyltransferase AglD